ncbi:nuclear transport factor 2 family protein [Streptomyces pinistramenti]|uniref:nuclear transport factor 2 family protein n=1 Tax=Streptomyces pinistramenti TaxID=2884812 RepID=UPI001D0854A7|nr:nuclear transport factor 2 family protein [Streptomyces pinistramenti]MCB5906209.1 nuclear transport factor 2 family protein [Streptomyces pinistramenti]
MPHTASPTAPPEWVLQIMHEIDTLSFGEGFARLADDAEMYFGTAHVVGAEAIKAFFVAIDEPLDIVHDVLESWTTADGVCFLRGEATMAKKTEPGNIVRAPFMHLYHLDDGQPARIKTLRITAGPLKTDAVL